MLPCSVSRLPNVLGAPVKGPDAARQLQGSHECCCPALQCGQAAARQMARQNEEQPGRGGCIINMSSVNAVMAIPTVAGYCASKGGVNNLTRSARLQCPAKLHGLQGSACWQASRVASMLSVQGIPFFAKQWLHDAPAA